MQGFALILISNVCVCVVHLHLYLYIHLCGYIYICITLCICTYVFTCTQMHTCVFVYTHAYICVFVHVCVQRLRDQRMVFIYLSIYFWLCWIFVARGAFSSRSERGTTLQLPCTGLSLRWLLLLQSVGSRAHRLQQLWYLSTYGIFWTGDQTLVP